MAYRLLVWARIPYALTVDHKNTLKFLHVCKIPENLTLHCLGTAGTAAASQCTSLQHRGTGCRSGIQPAARILVFILLALFLMLFKPPDTLDVTSSFT